MIEELFKKAEAKGTDGSFIRIDDQHPVGLFVGFDGGRRCILAVCPRRPPIPPPIGALHIDIRPRTTPEWALIIRLERPDLSALFTHLVEDLATSTLWSPSDPGPTVINRLTCWQRLLARGPSALLDDNQLRGLVGELAFLLDEAVPHVGHAAAMAAWFGPIEAPKDFVFDDREVEVKATRRQPRVFHISSIDQLTDAGLPLFLWTRVVEIEHRQTDPTRSAAAWVRRARSTFAQHAAGAQRLEEALRLVGWEDREEYETRIMRVGAIACFRVHGTFPRIQRTQVANGVVEGRYTLDAGLLAPFAVPDWRGR